MTPFERYSPEFGRTWADPKETRPTVTPVTQIVERWQVVMIETVPSRDDGFPDKKVETVIANKEKKLINTEVADAVKRVMR